MKISGISGYVRNYIVNSYGTPLLEIKRLNSDTPPQDTTKAPPTAAPQSVPRTDPPPKHFESPIKADEFEQAKEEAQKNPTTRAPPTTTTRPPPPGLPGSVNEFFERLTGHLPILRPNNNVDGVAALGEETTTRKSLSVPQLPQKANPIAFLGGDPVKIAAERDRIQALKDAQKADNPNFDNDPEGNGRILPEESEEAALPVESREAAAGRIGDSECD